MMEMDLQGWLTSVLASWGLVSVASVLTHGVMLVLLVGVAFLADAVCRCFLLKAVARLVKHTKATWDDVVFDHKVMVSDESVLYLLFFLFWVLFMLF